eukprot:CAMPEP_0175648632 /NCGR_PEP_ID=MMETSP0097-20121207/8428_1 /TAXON_ID=311494 /ORGANISM="Alexandrium monilatum, Strain CCMP3105" /LENGTH=56 /DNA_ID=CAMNT_0016954549 /DNA_START=292 /DNA_END=459 /DNA_ORIENTATION=-
MSSQLHPAGLGIGELLDQVHKRLCAGFPHVACGQGRQTPLVADHAAEHGGHSNDEV